MNRYITINSYLYSHTVLLSDDDSHAMRERALMDLVKFIEDHSDANGCFEGMVVSREVKRARKVG